MTPTTQTPDWRAWVPPPGGERFSLAATLPELPGLWDLARDQAAVAHWVAVLRGNADYVEALVADAGPETAAATAPALAALRALLMDLEAGRAQDRIRSVHDVTRVRENLLRAHGSGDPYAEVKRRETRRWWAAARARVTAMCAAARGKADGSVLAPLIAGLWAGNLFDLGSQRTQEAYRCGRLDPEGARARLQPRAESAVAHLPAAAMAFLAAAPRPLEEPAAGTLLFFVDNAGADFLLGVLPLAAYWAHAWEVRVACNAHPASSDITYAEAGEQVARLTAECGALRELCAAGRVRLISTGTGTPGIDFRDVGAELNAAAEGCDWIVIEGQGRAIETNWRSTFRRPVLRAAVAKDDWVAAALGLEPESPLLHWQSSAPQVERPSAREQEDALHVRRLREEIEDA